MTKILIIQRIVPHYRISFFKQLRSALREEGLDLILVYGQHLAGTVPESVCMDEPWAIKIENRYWKFLGIEAVYQPVPADIVRDAGIVIVEQANRLLLNYHLIYKRRSHGFKLIFWGHGKNFQAANHSSFFSGLKKFLMRFPDHWFAYTKVSEKVLIDNGIDAARVTTVNNSINTRALAKQLESLTRTDLDTLRESLKLDRGPVGLFCGGMDDRKRLPLLLEALPCIKERLPGFSCLFIGNGPHVDEVRRAADRYSWVHYLGKITSADRAKYFAVSDVMLMPGALGLVIIDSLITGTPIVTTNIGEHNPEIAYLEHQRNAIFAQNNLQAFVDASVDLLTSESLLTAMRANCREDASQYTLQAMVANFKNGIHSVLPG